MAAGKTKSAPKRASSSKSRASKSATSRSSTKKSTAKTVSVNAEHGFAPGTEVGIYKPEEAEYVNVDEREPFGDPETTAKVNDQGEISVSGLKKGRYVAVGKIAERGGRFGARFRQVQFVVK